MAAKTASTEGGRSSRSSLSSKRSRPGSRSSSNDDVAYEFASVVSTVVYADVEDRMLNHAIEQSRADHLQDDSRCRCIYIDGQRVLETDAKWKEMFPPECESRPVPPPPAVVTHDESDDDCANDPAHVPGKTAESTATSVRLLVEARARFAVRQFNHKS